MKLMRKDLEEKLEFKNNQRKLVMEFQRELPILTENGEGFCVNARDLHNELEVGRDFSTWIKARIKKYNFSENEDYIVYREISDNPKGGRPITEYKLTLDMAILLCEKETKNPNTSGLLSFFYLIKDNNCKIVVKEQPRLECQFGKMLQEITQLDWKIQYPIDNNKYRLDFYLPHTLIVEYDECHHQYQEKEDKERIQYCREWLANNDENELEYGYSDWRLPVIRVKQGKEFEGIRRILSHLAYSECKFLDGYYYKIEENCDIY